jgi:hypothetical protein
MLLTLFCESCFIIGREGFDDLVKKSPGSWSTRDCITIGMGASRNNLGDSRNPEVKVVATVYGPSVIMAAYRRGEILGRHHQLILPPQVPPVESIEGWPSEVTQSSVNQLLKEEVGVSYDWKKEQYVDGRGMYISDCSQIDSFEIFIVMYNKGWPVYHPDILNLENQIYLENDQRDLLKPIWVWGKHGKELNNIEQDLLAMFPIRYDEVHHFLRGSRYMTLFIDGFVAPVRIQFPVSVLR